MSESGGREEQTLQEPKIYKNKQQRQQKQQQDTFSCLVLISSSHPHKTHSQASSLG